MDSNRDWTGNSKSTFGSLGASNHTEKDREVHDFYATSPKAIDALLSKEELPKNIWECACGSGCLSKRLEEYGYNVTSTDLYNNGYGKIGIDFLKEAERSSVGRVSPFWLRRFIVLIIEVLSPEKLKS